jgi:hypothetical protein
MGVHDHVVSSSPMNVLSIWEWYLLYLGDFGRQSTSERSISGSSSSPDATLNSPLTRRHHPAPGITHRRPHAPLVEQSLESKVAEEQLPGRFERDFVEDDEVGRGPVELMQVDSRGDVTVDLQGSCSSKAHPTAGKYAAEVSGKSSGWGR